MRRRKLLEKSSTGVGIVLFGASVTGNAAADDSTVHGVNTDFDPDSERAIRRFFKELGEVEKEEARVEVHESLGQPQAKAITEVLQEIEVDVVVDDPTNRDVSTHSGSSSVSAEVSGEHWAFNYTVFSFEYEVEWDYDQNEVSNIQEMDRPNTYDPTWSADGETGSNWMHDNGDTWNGRSQHMFSYVGGGSIPTIEATPWIELEGTAAGFGFTVDSGDGI